MNWNDFNCVSTVKPTECKDLFIRLKEQCLSRPCPAVNAISQAYLDLSAKLNYYFFFNKTPTLQLSIYYLCVKTPFEY